LQALWAHYNKANSRTIKSKFFKSAVLFSKLKLNTYFDKILINPNVSFYAVATALHPKLRAIWFKTQWKRFPQWYKKAKASLLKVFKQYADEDEAKEEHPIQPVTRQKVPAGGTNAL
jgi:hypothetical protein